MARLRMKEYPNFSFTTTVFRTLGSTSAAPLLPTYSNFLQDDTLVQSAAQGRRRSCLEERVPRHSMTLHTRTTTVCENANHGHLIGVVQKGLTP